MSASTGVLDRLRKPEYTGENRCIPCTATNVVIATALTAAVSYGWFVTFGSLWWLAGGGLFVLSLAAIWLRGYLVPSTPELTKRYFPDWLLAKFDRVPPSVTGASGGERQSGETVTAGVAETAGETIPAGTARGTAEEVTVARAEQPRFVDPEEALLSAGVVEPCEGHDDICLTDGFEEAWLAAVCDLRDGLDPEEQGELLAAALGLEAVTFDRDRHDRAVATAQGEQIETWVSEGALVGDLAALRVLGERVDGWHSIPLPQRTGIARALRSFYSTCPLCEGSVAATEDTVESCCRSWEVVAVRCTDCQEHLLELDPAQFSDGPPDEGVSPTKGGFTR